MHVRESRRPSVKQGVSTPFEIRCCCTLKAVIGRRCEGGRNTKGSSSPVPIEVAWKNHSRLGLAVNTPSIFGSSSSFENRQAWLLPQGDEEIWGKHWLYSCAICNAAGLKHERFKSWSRQTCTWTPATSEAEPAAGIVK